MRFRSRLGWLLLIAAIASTAQTLPTASPAAKNAKTQWLERAKLLTAAIQEDAQNLSPAMQTVLPGRLGELWRTADPARAKAWLKETVTKLATIPDQESADDRKARLQASYALLSGLNKSDPDAADKLLDSLILQVQPAIARNPLGIGRTPEASNLGYQIETAIRESAGEHRLERATALAQRIIDLKDGNGVVSTYFALRDLDPERANQFVADALRAAAQNYDWFLLFGLAQVAVPPHDAPDEAPPEQLSNNILEVLAAGMLRVPQSAEDKLRICELAPAVAGALSKYSPEQQVQLRAAVDNCKSASSNVARNIRHLEAAAQTGNTAELITRATTADDALSRAQLKLRAAQEAGGANGYRQALNIIESLTAEEREAAPQWSQNWAMTAIKAVHSRFEAHDLQGVQQILARAPDDQRASMMLTASSTAYQAKDATYGLVMLTEARRELEKNPVTTIYQPYMELLSAYGAHVPDEASSVLRLVVTGINNFKVPEKAKIRPVEFGWQLRPILLPDALLDSDSQMTAAAISELNSPQARVAMRLGLLEKCLQRYERPEKRTAPKTDLKTPATPSFKTKN